MAEKRTIARPYAQAVFELAAQGERLPAWSEMLALMRAVISDARVRALADNPRVSKSELIDIFLGICGDRIDAPARNLVRVLAGNGRLTLLPEIAALYEVYRAEAEKKIQGELISAFPVSESLLTQIGRALKARLGREVTLQCKTDEKLVGGAIIRAGDMVIDGSVIGHLDRLSGTLSH